ncbi:unnamed protein product, partial [Discosporangium mesarthrocarpum]
VSTSNIGRHGVGTPVLEGFKRKPCHYSYPSANSTTPAANLSTSLAAHAQKEGAAAKQRWPISSPPAAANPTTSTPLFEPANCSSPPSSGSGSCHGMISKLGTVYAHDRSAPHKLGVVRLDKEECGTAESSPPHRGEGQGQGEGLGWSQRRKRDPPAS